MLQGLLIRRSSWAFLHRSVSKIRLGRGHDQVCDPPSRVPVSSTERSYRENAYVTIAIISYNAEDKLLEKVPCHAT